MARSWATVILFSFVFQQLTQAMKQPNDDPHQVKKVHLVFMNHLDVGYDGILPTTGFALNVINRYFTTYYPRAVGVAELLREMGYAERLVYTTHPWLLYLYLHCSPFTLATNITLKCPAKIDSDAMRVSIGHGDVVWHAGPMNMQYEFMHPVLFDLSLNFSSLLDEEFNIKRTTPVISQRDVPGMTKAVIPVLKKHKIQAISVGVNDMTSPPALPRTPFIWKASPHDSDQDGVIAFWHPGGYPDNPGTYPAKPGGLSWSDCLFAPDVATFPEVLCFAFRTDNSGPPESISEVLNNFEVARGQFPKAVVVGSTLDRYVAALKASRVSLPVVTQEVGDTWIMGVQSDPKKVALYRGYSGVLAECFQSGECSMGDPQVRQAMHYLTKVPEHTWGLMMLNDLKNWSNAAFQKARPGKPYRDCEASWVEQRQFADLALRSLGSHPVVKRLVDAASQLKPKLPDLSKYAQISSFSSEQKCSNGIILQFSADGSLVKLYDPFNKVNWASEQSLLGQILYSTYNESDYDYMSKLYDYKGQGGAGFHKINSTRNAHPQSRTWPFSLQGLYRRKGSDNCDFIVKAGPVDRTAVTQYGAPPLFYVQYKSTDEIRAAKGGLDVVVQWFNKAPTRLAEALSFGFTPVTQVSGRWTLSKLGSMVDPLNVVLNGSQYLHAIDKGVNYTSQRGAGLQILSQDVALVTLGTDTRPPSVLPVPLSPICHPVRSATFNLYNNLWSTNYIYWYPFLQEDAAFKARFSVSFV
ncbi:uncharacterized protein LOC143276017 [Babylonia areolata]|uniref:uncharacterized protein LOC143276017 n=1 Tax=Babylonia areolata TaxID=304850 RepID=UPI003FD37020